MNSREIKLNAMFAARRERLGELYALGFADAGVCVEDALAKAFEYTVERLLEETVDFDANDFERVINWKLTYLYRDAFDAKRRTHGRKSVKAAVSFDAEEGDDDEYRIALIDKAAMVRHREAASRRDVEKCAFLQAKAIYDVLGEHGVSARDRDIYDRLLWTAPDRKALAAEMHTSVSNLGRIKCECRDLSFRFKAEIRARYAELSLRYAA